MGNDTYTVGDDSFLVVLENGNSSNDVLTATGIGIGTADVAIIDGRHLGAIDPGSNQHIILLNALDGNGNVIPENVIETFNLATGPATFDEVRTAIENDPDLLEVTFQELDDLGLVDLGSLGIDPANPDAANGVNSVIELVEAKSIGDPHITTLDGLYYDFQAIGEFTLVKSLDTDLDIQVRQDKIEGIREDATVNTALATKLGNDKVELYVGEAAQIELNDIIVDLEIGEVKKIGSGSIGLETVSDAILGDGLSYTINYENGEKIVAEMFELETAPDSYYLNPYVYLYNNQSTEGLLGNFDGIADNDLVLGNGTVISRPDNPLDLNGAYADTWQVEASNLLLNTVDSPAVI